MQFKEISSLNDEKFLSLVGIPRNIFEKILLILKVADAKKKCRGGAPNKLVLEDRILMTIEYWHKHYTYFYIGTRYGISESSCYRNIRWIEDILIDYPDLQWSELIENSIKNKNVNNGISKISIQRSKKVKSSSIQEKQKNIYED